MGEFAYPDHFQRRFKCLYIQLIIGIAVVGVILWLINTYIPMQAGVKKILNIVIIVVLILYLLSAFGVLAPSSGLRVRGW